MQRSSLNSTHIKTHNLKDTLKETIGETSILPDRQKVKRGYLGNTLSTPFSSGSCNFLDGLERVTDRVHDKTCPQLIITSPTSDNVDSYECDTSEQVNSTVLLIFDLPKAVNFAFLDSLSSFSDYDFSIFDFSKNKFRNWNHIIKYYISKYFCIYMNFDFNRRSVFASTTRYLKHRDNFLRQIFSQLHLSGKYLP